MFIRMWNPRYVQEQRHTCMHVYTIHFLIMKGHTPQHTYMYKNIHKRVFLTFSIYVYVYILCACA